MAHINLTPTSFDEIKRSIIHRFKNDPKETFLDYDFSGSSIQQLIDILSYVTMYNNYYNSSSTNELFLPYAQRAKNVYALSRTLGYIPKRPTAASAYIRPTIPELHRPDLTKDIVIPVYSQLKSEKGLNYILMEEIRYRYDTVTSSWRTVRNDVFETEEGYYYQIKQGQFQSTAFIPSQRANQRVLIDKKNIDDSYNSIIVQDSVTYEYWDSFHDISDFNLDTSHNILFANNNSIEDLKDEIIINDAWENYILDLKDSKIFFINGDESGTYVSFGDGILGSIPENTMDILYILTEGVKGNGDTNFMFNGIISYAKTDGSVGSIALKKFDATIMENTSSTGGALEETTGSIKKLAPSFYNSQNREVTETDYEVHLMQQKSVPLLNVKCIGGEELKPIVMGAVGICANKSTESGNIEQSLLNFPEKELLKLILKNKNVITINPIFINPEFVKIHVDVKVYFNPVKFEEYKVFQIASDTIKVFFSTIQGFKKYYKSSHLISIFDDMEEIDHNLTNTEMEYARLIGKSEIKDYMYINLGDKNPILEGSIGQIKSKDHFMKIFNTNTYYPATEYNELTNPTGVFVPPEGISGWDINFYRYSSGEANSFVHKIFLYDLEVGETNENGVANLYLVEKMPHRLKANRISGSNDAPFRFTYEDIRETGKKKLIGEIFYNRGLIRVYFDDVSFRYLDVNKKSRRLASETIKHERKVKGSSEVITTYIDVDGRIDSYESFDDIFFHEFKFDEISNLPIYEDPVTERYEPYFRTAIDEFWFNMKFDTQDEDFESQGNVIMALGDYNIERIKEVYKK